MIVNIEPSTLDDVERFNQPADSSFVFKCTSDSICTETFREMSLSNLLETKSMIWIHSVESGFTRDSYYGIIVYLLQLAEDIKHRLTAIRIFCAPLSTNHSATDNQSDLLPVYFRKYETNVSDSHPGDARKNKNTYRLIRKRGRGDTDTSLVQLCSWTFR